MTGISENHRVLVTVAQYILLFHVKKSLKNPSVFEHAQCKYGTVDPRVNSLLLSEWLYVPCYNAYAAQPTSEMSLFFISDFQRLFFLLLLSPPKLAFVLCAESDSALSVCLASSGDRLCLVVRVPGYRSRGPGFDSRPYQIF
jgi:hypothetical protein